MNIAHILGLAPLAQARGTWLLPAPFVAGLKPSQANALTVDDLSAVPQAVYLGPLPSDVATLRSYFDAATGATGCTFPDLDQSFLQDGVDAATHNRRWTCYDERGNPTRTIAVVCFGNLT